LNFSEQRTGRINAPRGWNDNKNIALNEDNEEFEDYSDDNGSEEEISINLTEDQRLALETQFDKTIGEYSEDLIGDLEDVSLDNFTSHQNKRFK